MKSKEKIIYPIAFCLLTIGFLFWAISSRDFSHSGEIELPDMDGKTTVIARTDAMNLVQSGGGVGVEITGTLKNRCTHILQVETLRSVSEKNFDIEVIAQREKGQCEKGLVQFSREVPLNTADLEPGEYTVTSSEQQKTFVLE